MIEQIIKYYEKLFADPIKVVIAGKEVSIQPQRTNNMMEHFFRYLKRLLRKRSGNISVKRSLTAMLPGTVLVKNLNNEVHEVRPCFGYTVGNIYFSRCLEVHIRLNGQDELGEINGFRVNKMIMPA